MRTIIASIIAATVVLTAVHADGGFVGPRLSARAEGQGGVSSPGQKGIIVDGRDGTELLILQTTYRGPSEDFAWVVPVPGLPVDGGVFAPSPFFIDMAFFLTQTETQTDIAVQRPQTGLVFAGTRASEKGRIGERDRVTLYRRLTAGDYDAAVLSADNADDLRVWLTDEGFVTSDEARDAFAHYIGRGWYFVALKVRPEITREQPLLRDVQPIAIRFPTERLTFPLFISRASAPERTSLSLIVLADDAVGCDQIGWATIPTGRIYPPGHSWARLRRQMVSGREAEFVCDSMSGIPVPSVLDELREGAWIPRPEDARGWTATRMFTVLAPDEMVDLTFSTGAAPDAQPSLLRSATVRDIFARSPWAVLLAGTLFAVAVWGSGAWRHEVIRLTAALGAVLAVWGVGAPTLAVLLVALPALLLTSERIARGGDGTSTSPLRRGRGPTPAALALFVGMGWAAVLIAAGAAEPAPAFVAADGAAAQAYYRLVSVMSAPLLIFGTEFAWTVATWLLLRRHLREWPDEHHTFFFGLTAGMCLLYVLSTGLGLSLPGIFGNLDLLPGGLAGLLHVLALGTGIAVLCFTMIAPLATERSRRIAQGFAAVAGLMAVLVIAGNVRVLKPAEAGTGSAQARAVSDRLDRALGQVDGALAAFAEDTGALPARLEDLTGRTAPAEGVDGSGNPVAIDASADGPWLVALPIDPLTGRRDSWVYEVTGEPMVASGGYALRIERGARLNRSHELSAWGIAHERAMARSGEATQLPERIREALGWGSEP